MSSPVRSKKKRVKRAGDDEVDADPLAERFEELERRFEELEGRARKGQLRATRS